MGPLNIFLVVMGTLAGLFLMVSTIVCLIYYFCCGDKPIPRLSPEELRRIPVIKYEGGEPFTNCAICLEGFRRGASCRILPGCGHRFHAVCIGRWLNMSATCPLCRAVVVVGVAEGHEMIALPSS